MELIERWSRKLPMMFLVQIAQRHRVRQQLVEVVHAVPADFLRQRDRQLDEVSEWLNLMCVLMGQRLRLVQNRVGVNQSLGHVDSHETRPATTDLSDESIGDTFISVRMEFSAHGHWA